MKDRLSEYRFQEHGTEYFQSSFRFLWPRWDELLHHDIPTLKDLDDFVFPEVQQKHIVVQAGGAMGVWPKRMAQVFDTVYTFEPTPQSFYCLNYNCPEENIVSFNAALGKSGGMVSMDYPEYRSRSATGKDNYGGFRCFSGGRIPTIRLDDLHLPGCDLLFLDLEGYELYALQGATLTIRKYQPIIVLEDKGCSENFGYQKGDVEEWLEMNAGYETLSRFHGGRDVMMGSKNLVIS